MTNGDLGGESNNDKDDDATAATEAPIDCPGDNARVRALFDEEAGVPLAFAASPPSYPTSTRPRRADLGGDEAIRAMVRVKLYTKRVQRKREATA